MKTAICNRDSKINVSLIDSTILHFRNIYLFSWKIKLEMLEDSLSVKKKSMEVDKRNFCMCTVVMECICVSCSVDT